MKEARRQRGLYVNVTRSGETEAEKIEMLKSMATWLDEYIADAERLAGDVLRDHGIDPETLWEPVVDDNNNRNWHYPFVVIDRASIHPLADQALDILANCRAARPHLDGERKGLWTGIALAQAFERLQTNLHFYKPVTAGRGTSIGGRKGALAVHGTPGRKSKEYRQKYLERRKLYPGENRRQACMAVAKSFNMTAPNSYKTIERATKGL